MEFMPTNDVFSHLLVLLRISDKDFIITLFESQSKTVSKSQIKAWQTKTGGQKKGYRAMPRDMLDAFIAALYAEKLIIDD